MREYLWFDIDKIMKVKEEASVIVSGNGIEGSVELERPTGLTDRWAEGLRMDHCYNGRCEKNKLGYPPDCEGCQVHEEIEEAYK